ncbi:hypothetical protein DH2020_026473 [Rehmannia glutinosa]|uniref:Clp R domain-containing protein n=1 Tax=Rehmannia glutinosa TaxID=99300 RepID=A0ABR0W0R5_REHGL
MRAGVCAAQQTLSAEAASVLKHSLTLARRRGHAQVTPLHVAATLLSSRASLLRRACLKSQPHQPSHHPLQCRALELCFNVALNRLPATPGPLLHAQPSLSNALVAALKRAQAHQRRGCIEQQQQQPPLIAIKVELEQLILSILDDPSVSRVMREAGFSSTAVKNNLEDTNNSVSSVFQCYNTSGGIYSTPNSPPTESHRDHVLNSSTFWHSSHLLSYASEQNPNFLFSPQKKPIISDASSSLKEDVHVVFDVLLRKKRKNTVIVGDTLSMAEGVVAEVMGKVERGDNIPEDLKSVHFIKFQFSSVPLRFMKKEEVEMNVSDLKRKVDSFASSGGGVIIYTGDLKWTVDHSGDDERELGNNVYSPVDHLIAEIGKMVSWYNNNSSSSNTRVWLMAIANYQTYMKCQMKQPPLDVHWSLQAVSVPSGGLGLSLNATSGQLDSRINFAKNPSHDLEKTPFNFVKEEQDVLTCCPECKSNYEKEASFKSIQQKSFPLNSINNDTENGSAQLPFWLKPHGIETLLKDDLIQLRRKYNKMCQSLHKGSHNNPNNPNSVISNQCYLGRDYNWPNKNSIYADSETISFAYPAVIKTNQTASSLPRFRRQQSCHIDFSFSNGSSKYQSVEPNLDSLKGIDDKELKITLALGNLSYTDTPTSEKMAIDADLFNVFQENVPWQCDTIPLILEALADSKGNDQDKFILIKGNDMVGKRRFAVGLAKFMFGSTSDLLFCMNMKDNVAEKREMLEKALRNHEKLVVLVEDVDYADCEFAKFLAEGYETGKMDNGHAIFILTMDGEKGYNKSKENVDSVIQMKLLVNNLDHNKRKADNWDLPIRSKNQRNNEIDQEVSSDFADKIKIRQFTKESNSNALDLNLKADEEADKSDSTSEITPNSLRFLEKIKNRYVLNRDSDQEARAREMFLSKLKKSFDEVCGSRNITSSFTVEEKVLEEILQGSGLYLNSLFEQWLKEVFQTSLRMVDSGNEGERVNIRLCLGGKGESCPEDGFMGTCLPKSIT